MHGSSALTAATAVNTEMGLELLDVWTDFVRNNEGLRCVVLTGAGEEAFCAGGDMKQRKDMSEYDWRHQHEIFEQGLWTQWVVYYDMYDQEKGYKHVKPIYIRGILSHVYGPYVTNKGRKELEELEIFKK